MKLDPNLQQVLGNHEKQPFSNFIKESNKQFCSPEALDFLEKCLIYDHVTALKRPKESIPRML